MTRIGIIGLGLIGASLAARIKLYHPESVIYGVDCDQATRSIAREKHWADHTVATISELPEALDIAIVCTPLHRVKQDLIALRDHLTATTTDHPVIISDVASVKAPFADLTWPSHQIYIGGHPMSGATQTGIQHADASRLNHGNYILTPDDTIANHPSVGLFKDWLGTLNLTVHLMRADTHDQYVAMTSHVPYLMACLVALTTDPAALPVVGPGFRDTTRVAQHDTQWGQAVCQYNRVAIHQQLQQINQKLSTWLTQLDRNTETAFHEISHDLNRAKAARTLLT